MEVFEKIVLRLLYDTLFYVDDILICGPNIRLINETNVMLSSTNVKMTDLGESDVILGIRLSKVAFGYTFFN